MDPVNRRGFTLVEVIAAVALLVLTVAIDFASGRSARGQMTVHGVAAHLLADLRWARQRAAMLGVPMGVLIPTGQAASRSYAVIEADPDTPGAMLVERVADWTAGLRDAFLGVGTWTGLDFSWGAAPSGTRWEVETRTLLDRWMRTWAGRYLLFSPQSQVVSEAVPQAGGVRYLVVAAGMEPQGTAGSLWARLQPRQNFRLEAHRE